MFFKKVVFALSLAAGSFSAHAEDAPLGVDCTITDVGTSRVTPYQGTSRGPWLIHEEQLSSNGNDYVVRIEANNEKSWGVLSIKNVRTGKQNIHYGAVGTQETFDVGFDSVYVTCKHFPYNPG